MDLFGVLQDAYPTLLKGLATTVEVTVISLLIATVLGIITCLFRQVVGEVLYLADPRDTDAGAGFVYLSGFAPAFADGHRIQCEDQYLHSQYSDVGSECRCLYVRDIPRSDRGG